MKSWHLDPEAHQGYFHLHCSREKRGEKRGIIQGKPEIALNLLQEGMTVEEVVKFTGLARELLLSLSGEIKD